MSPRVVSAFALRRAPWAPPWSQANKEKSNNGKINWTLLSPTRTSSKYLVGIPPSPHPPLSLGGGPACLGTPPQCARERRR